MLDLSCSYQGKKVTVTISKKLEMKVEGNMTASDHISVVTALKTVAEKYRGKNIFNQEFGEVVKDVVLVEKFKELIVKTRSTHLSYKLADKAKDELRSFTHEVFYGSKYGGRAEKAKFSVPQKIVLFVITNKFLCSGISSEDFTNLYAPISKNRDKITALHEELMSFQYKSYLNKEQHSDVVNKIAEKREQALKAINVYETVCDEAGKDLVNWSQHKISRRLNQETDISNWIVTGFITKMQESLLTKGVEKEAPKPKKTSRGEDHWKRFCEGAELTQEEILKVFKQTNFNMEMIPLMDLNSIYELMDSELKGVQEKLGHSYDKRFSLNSCGRALLNRAIQIAPTTKENFNKLRTYSEVKCDDQLSWEYTFKNSDYINTDYVINKVKRIGMSEDVPSEFYDKFLAHLDNITLVNLNDSITKEFVSRLSEEDKIGILPRLGGRYVPDNTENATHFLSHFDWWDYVKRTHFDEKDLYDLYKDVPWEAIKPTVLELSSLRQNAVELAILNEDKEAGLEILKESGKNLDVYNKVRLLSMFDKRTQVKTVLESALSGETFLKNCFDQVLGPTEFKSLFAGIIGRGDAGFLDKIIELTKEHKMDQKEFRYMILNRTDLGILPMSSTMNKFLDNETKIHILKTGCNLAVHKETSFHGQRTEGVSPLLNEFFSTLKRKELTKIFGENLVESQYRLYLCHAMTPDERGIASQDDKTFLRVHVEQIPYSYLQKYQDKKLFKELVGDRRKPNNDSFALSLERKFQEALKTKINPANSIKLMFA